MPPLGIVWRLLLTAIFFTSVNTSLPHLRHHKRHTHHKFPDDSVVVGLHHMSENDGHWGEWSDSSECSRSCGGGVAHQTRRCDDTRENGSSACSGPSKRYISCNIQDCPESSEDFREIQCAKFDSIPFGGKYFKWVPYKKGFNECELNCMPQGGDKFYYRHSQAVVDGTRCREDSMDICVQGVCMAVGCDMMLGSNVVEDKCQECGGDGSNCKTVEGVFNQKNLHVGYNDIILIPAGATTIRIKELEPTNNYLAIRNSSGHYYLNGNWQIEFPRKLKFAGTHFHYEREQKGFVTLESIHAAGPTTEPIYIALLYQQKNLGIGYEYSLPLGISNTQPDNYGWQYSNFGACSHSCGGGIQTRSISCATSVSNEVVEDYLCNVVSKPPHSQSCNEQPCPAHWQVSVWDECSKPCEGGVQYRQVHCQHQSHNGMAMVSPDAECVANDGPKPVYAKSCNDDACPIWQVGEWSMCNQICGEGDQTREVNCVLKHGGGEKIVNSSSCTAEKPPVSRTCQLRPCEGMEWIISQWSGCFNTCGLNFESREAHCASVDGNLHSQDMCSGKAKPPLRRPCSNHLHCDAMWHASEWSECSTRCGNGIRTRMVFCGSWKGSEIDKLPDHTCPPDTKMPSIEDCHLKPCTGVWYTGPWTRCSVFCGGGHQSRKVMCLLDNSIVSHSHCDISLQPYDSETCHMHPCDEDEVMMVGGCHKSKHGCCLDGVTPAGPDYEGCPFDASEQDCKETEFGCCMDGITPASGPFEKGCAPMGNCNETKFGCCPDNVTPAKNEDKLGCYEDCENSLWGCCSDGVTSATGPDNKGCNKHDKDCRDTKHGCCPDGITSSTGPNYEGCDFDVSSGEDCVYSHFGCCSDGLTAAEGADMLGCPKSTEVATGHDCARSTHGCCEDGLTPAQGPDFKGCEEEEGSGEFETNCRNTLYGCCPDDDTPAKGPHNSGCHSIFKYDTNITQPVDSDGSKLFVCSASQYGCCKDGISAASGPNYEGCYEEEISFSSHCSNTVFGCCHDDVTTAQGPNKQGCCLLTSHGCCPDNITAADGPHHQGCDCHTYPYGCCQDGVTHAKGPRFEGCSCEHSQHGCCQDQYSYATGPHFDGCNCSTMLYGCCLDNLTPAKGLYGEGCECEFLHYGCCPDSQSPALGHHFTGCSCKTFPHGCCPDGITVSKGSNIDDCPCNATTHGCCPDHKTAAKGPYNEGCPCHSLVHGCCPDNESPALGPNFIGCPCMVMPFGCCPDKQMAAAGPDFIGCPCKSMEFGCCPDGETTASGPRYGGCPCTTFPYGCCADGVTPARDQHFGGCKETKKAHKNSVTADVCRMSKERGPCHNFSVKWYFDMAYGGCSRFWYGGCDGNGNQFNSQEDCEKMCVNPEGPDACMLPKVIGPCKGAHQAWYYEPKTDSCNSFNYSGCLGNNNRYATKEICENTCVQQAIVDSCDQPLDVGPCKKVTQRWFYDKAEGLCKPFIFGGCKGNGNNFESEKECLQKCIMEKPKDLATVYNASIGSQVTIVCKSVPQSADDEPVLFLWYKGDSAFPIHGIDRRESSSGKNLVSSRGTDPRFSVHDSVHMTALTIHKIRQEDQGDYRCRVDFKIGSTTNKFFKLIITEPSICHLSQAVGNCYHFRERWHYNSNERRCQRFYYSGCGGNENNFATYIECEKKCEKSSDIPEEEFKLEYCETEPDAGPCNARKIQWFYDKDGVCKQFYYGGCRGNGNRFNTKKECELRCSASQDICQLPKIRGPCSGTFTQWYFDKEQGECNEFLYSGCQGNANRFNDKESCEIQCKKWPSEDVQQPQGICSQPKDPGPCLGYFLMWYHDDFDSTCRSFVYGGCHGNGNRFASLQECQAKCHANSAFNIPKVKQAHSLTAEASFKTNEDICRQPPDDGHCSDSQSRWYYDSHKLMCLPFVYKGCGGNKNRFKSSDLCLRFCSGVQDVVRDAAAVEDSIEVGANCPTSNCNHLQCPHGMEEIVDVRGCISCLCTNPCENHSCPNGTQCVVEKHRKLDGDFRSQPLCRLKLKSGQCPASSSEPHLNGTCHDRCHSDADCPGGLKCCYISCANVCILPVISDDEAHDEENDIDGGLPLPTQIVSARKDIAVKAGDPALLRCIVKGYPTPKVTWYQNNNPLGTESEGYKISVDGSLHIMSTSEVNSGIYTCSADNGVGQPVKRFFNLIVYEDTKVNIALITEHYQVGSPLQLDCIVKGTTPLEVTWHIGKDTPPLGSNDHREIFSNHTLYISSAQYNDSGSYICQAQNQHGKASDSHDIQVHDVPIPSSCKDSPFFTSCAMIVEQNYCINPTYAKFCCKSCAISGQLQRVNEID